MKEPPEHRDIGLSCSSKIVYRSVVKEKTPHRAREPCRERNTEPVGNLDETGHQLARSALDDRVQLGSQRSQRSFTRSHRKWIARKGSRLINRARRSDHLHDVPAAAVRRGRKATTDHLAQRRQVSGYAESLERTGRRNPESRHHLIEDEQRTALVSELSKSFEKSGQGSDEPGVSDKRLDDDRRKLAVRSAHE